MPDDINKSKNLLEVEIDKISYDNDGKIILADFASPKLFTKTILVKKNYKILERSNRFSCPKIESYELLVNNNEITIRLCLSQYINAKIYLTKNNNRYEVFDTLKNNNDTYNETIILPNTVYSYSIVPYYVNENKIYYGKEVFLEKIKSPTNFAGDNWWDKDLN